MNPRPFRTFFHDHDLTITCDDVTWRGRRIDIASLTDVHRDEGKRHPTIPMAAMLAAVEGAITVVVSVATRSPVLAIVGGGVAAVTAGAAVVSGRRHPVWLELWGRWRGEPTLLFATRDRAVHEAARFALIRAIEMNRTLSR